VIAYRSESVAIEPVYTVPEGAQMLKISKWTLWQKLSKGEIKRTKIGGRTVIRETELLKLLRDEGQ
jgi:excisionase family DNA binding protein